MGTNAPFQGDLYDTMSNRGLILINLCPWMNREKLMYEMLTNFLRNDDLYFRTQALHLNTTGQTTRPNLHLSDP